MQTDTPDAGQHEIRRYAVVAIVIALGLFVLVPTFRKSPTEPGTKAVGVVPVQIVAAGAEPASAATPPLQPAVIVRAIARAKPKAAVQSAAVSVTSDQAGSAPSFSAEDQASYEEDLYNHIAKYIRYPRAALHVCPSGTARLRFQSSRQGQLLSIVVEQSSGCAIIDNEAIETVRRAQPLPAIPAALSERMTVRMPLSFGKS